MMALTSSKQTEGLVELKLAGEYKNTINVGFIDDGGENLYSIPLVGFIHLKERTK